MSSLISTRHVAVQSLFVVLIIPHLFGTSGNYVGAMNELVHAGSHARPLVVVRGMPS